MALLGRSKNKNGKNEKNDTNGTATNGDKNGAQRTLSLRRPSFFRRQSKVNSPQPAPTAPAIATIPPVLPPIATAHIPPTGTANVPPTPTANVPPPAPAPQKKHVPIPKPPDPSKDPAGYLRSLQAVRERSRIVFDMAKTDKLSHFRVDMDKFDDTAGYVSRIIKRDYAPNLGSIPPHGRWQHFEVGGVPRITNMMRTWPASVDTLERTRRLVDLFLVSVLLDAGAGNRWSYKSNESGKSYRRSEGLAVASLEMFQAGIFSSDPEQPCRVDAVGLQDLTVQIIRDGLQVSEKNPMDGLDGRTGLLLRLAEALGNQEFFGATPRPGNMVDYLVSLSANGDESPPVVSVTTLWTVLMDGLAPIWPATRTQIDGRSIGDAWPCSSMPSEPSQPWQSVVPFHKLTQWLTYSLMVPMQRLMQVQWVHAELLTGLPEYRNGGLLIDTGLLRLKGADAARGLARFQQNALREGQPNMEVVPLFDSDDDVVVEWRAITVGFLDLMLDEVNSMLKLEGSSKLSLAQMLEAGSWKGGREIAEVSRPNTRGPPIMILSDGTVF